MTEHRPPPTHVIIGVAPCNCVHVAHLDTLDRKTTHVVEDLERRRLEVRRVPLGSEESVTRPCFHRPA